MLVIIGLIIGGVLLGQDMIKAAETRAQITQIEKYTTAATTFVTKYGNLPGDLDTTSASNFGFVPRTGSRGRGDANGLIEGYCYPLSMVSALSMSGETLFYWEDLSSASILDGRFNSAADAVGGQHNVPSNLPLFLPYAKISGGNFIYVYTNGSKNYFGLSSISIVDTNGAVWGSTALSVQQAYNIDLKVDDGYPQTGSVTAQYLNTTLGGITWAGGGVAGTAPGGSATGSPTTCYDNAGGTGTMQYSMEISNGSGPNCGLSFKMQGAAR